jgi:hypothetical protein
MIQALRSNTWDPFPQLSLPMIPPRRHAAFGCGSPRTCGTQQHRFDFSSFGAPPPARSSGTHKRISSRKRQGLSRLVTAAEKRCGRASHLPPGETRRQGKNAPYMQKCFIIPALQRRLNGGFVRCLKKHSASIHGIALAESKL